MSTSWMIYGANGYTGKLISTEAVKQGMSPVLAGRKTSVSEFADSLGLESRIFNLADPAEIRNALDGISLVLHCAGPFSSTSRPMVDACLQKGIHYLDITGEIAVFEAIHSRSQEAKQAGSILIPGVGFDVVPSDCLAALLSNSLPKAIELHLAFGGDAKLSPGTAKTMVENLSRGGCVRRNGTLTSVPTAAFSKLIEFSSGKMWATSIPWGDVSTAFYSTGIPNITVYRAVPKKLIYLLKALSVLGPVLGLRWVQAVLKKLVDKTIKGPSEAERNTGKTFLWGCVSDGKKQVSATLEIGEGYKFTALAALESVKRVLSGDIHPGSWTPSAAFGAGFISQLPGSKLELGSPQ